MITMNHGHLSAQKGRGILELVRVGVIQARDCVLLPQAECCVTLSFLPTAYPVLDLTGAVQPYSRGEEEDVSGLPGASSGWASEATASGRPSIPF